MVAVELRFIVCLDASLVSDCTLNLCTLYIGVL